MNNFLKYNQIELSYNKNQHKILQKILSKVGLKLPSINHLEDGTKIFISFPMLPETKTIKIIDMRKFLIWAIFKKQQIETTKAKTNGISSPVY